jgi:hypothetical protein
MDVTFTKVAFQIGATVTASANINWAIYDSDSDGQPTTILYSGTVASGTTIGLREATGLSIPLVSQRVYWIGFNHNHTANMTIFVPASTTYTPFLIKRTSLASNSLAYTASSSTMPSTWTSTTTSGSPIGPWLGL